VFIKHAAVLEDIELDGKELFRNPNFHFVADVEESMAINRIAAGAIIIAASGMCDAGRIRHHLRHNLWRSEATVLLVGYQAPGTLGQLLERGETSVRMMGDEIAVKARIRKIDNSSAHADQRELVQWVVERLPVRSGIFLTHGEERAREVLREHLVAAGCAAEAMVLPKLDDGFALTVAAAPALAHAAERVAADQLVADWHNDHAAFLLRLRQTLDALPGDAERRRLLRRLHAQLPG
jgi:metallo-beta-lactamase family protein